MNTTEDLTPDQIAALQAEKTALLISWSVIKKGKDNYPKAAFKAFQSSTAKQLVEIEMQII